MKQDMTMGSLFSGSGGFELAASIFGIKPLWASEIEPLPILVTKKNFPDMPHLGDISYMDGGKIEPVTVLAGGSPCQDMSVAGLRAGLDGSRSNLFREQIRIVKEMRTNDIKAGRTGKYIRPRFMVWENVPGAFSSNKGADFQSVLQEVVSIADEAANVPQPPKGKWGGAGCIMGDSFSIAWRTLDAQYWGVPQRRKRIYLVADFGGNTAPKILFEREGLSRNFKASREAWQGTAGDTTQGTGGTGETNVHCYDISDRRRIANESIDVAPTLISKMGTGGNNVPVVLENHPQDSRVTIAEDGIVPTLTGKMGTGGGNVPMIMDNKVIPVADKATRNKGGGGTRNDDGAGNGLGVGEPGAPAYTLTAADRHGVAYAIDRAAFNQGANAQYNISIQEEVAQTLVAKGPGGVAHPQDRTDALCYAMQAFGQYKESEIASAIKARDFKDNTDLVVEPEYIIRRLTPLECCRLQGFPDDWTEKLAIENPTASIIREWMIVWAEWWRLVGRDKGIQLPKDAKQVERWLADPTSDSGLYMMWGNGIALPNAMFVMEGIAMILQEENEHEE